MVVGDVPKRVSVEIPDDLEEHFQAFADLNGFSRAKAAQALIVLAARHHTLPTARLRALHAAKKARAGGE
jgi:hypothetical protein